MFGTSKPIQRLLFPTAQVGCSIYRSKAVFLLLSMLWMTVWLLSAEILLAIDDPSGYIIYKFSNHKYMPSQTPTLVGNDANSMTD